MALALASLTWGISSRELVYTSKIEHHSTQQKDLDDSLQSILSMLSAEMQSGSRAFQSQLIATNARVDATNSRIDNVAKTKAA